MGIALSENTGIEPQVAADVDALAWAALRDHYSRSIDHALSWYGVDAVAHACLMQEALAAQDNLQTPAKFASHFGINNVNENDPLNSHGLIFNLDIFARESGVFVPAARRREYRPDLVVFDGDYINRLLGLSELFKQHSGVFSRHLMAPCLSPWQIGDFSDASIVQAGLNYARLMWARTVISAEEGLRGSSIEPPVDPEKADTYRELLEYYAPIVDPQKSPNKSPAHHAVDLMERLAYPTEERVRGVIHNYTMRPDFLTRDMERPIQEPIPEQWRVRDIFIEPSTNLLRRGSSWEDYKQSLQERGIKVDAMRELHETRFALLRTFFE